MIAFNPKRRFWLRVSRAGVAVVLTAVFFSSCATIQHVDTSGLRQTANLVEEVKAFGKTLGIEPTPALSRTSRQGPPLSMLWLWMQRNGTLALRAPIDIRMAIGFDTEKERLKIEQVYRVEGYSVYYRQGNEFADPRSVATIGFAAQPMVRQVMVILHEDLHGDANFALPWELEESIVTPLGWIAAAEYFQERGDEPNWQNARAALGEERGLARELTGLATEAERAFATLPVDDAKRKILDCLSEYPRYGRHFERQIRGQHPPTTLEAKLSHDWAYYRFFDQVVALWELAPDLKILIADLKSLPSDVSAEAVEKFLRDLKSKYSIAAN